MSAAVAELFCHRYKGVLIPGCYAAINGNACTCRTRRDLGAEVARLTTELERSTQLFLAARDEAVRPWRERALRAEAALAAASEGGSR